MHLNFDEIYDLLDQFAQQINANTNEVFTNIVTENIAEVSSQAGEASNTLQNTVDQ